MKNKLHFIAITFLFTTIAIAKGSNTTFSLWNAKNNSATNLVTNPPTGNPSQTFCAGMTLANIQVTGTTIKWYAAASGGSVLPSTTTLINSTSYYASQTVAGIESTTRLQITVTVNPIIIPTFTPVNSICSGDPVPILPTTSDNGILGTWNPPGISNTSSGEYTFTPTLTMAPGPDLVVNGNFSAGNTGFTTNYQYLTVSTPSGAQKTYGIVTNPQVWFTPFSSCPDHTSGTGKMMVVDGSGSNAGNDILWSQTIPVTAGENYTFSYYLQTIATPNPAQIEVVINGTIVGTATAGTTTCNWVQYSYVWNSAANTSAQISLYDRNVAANGNDFAIDDLSFTQNTSLCATNATMLVTVNPLPNATILGTPAIICPGEWAWVNIIGTPNATVTYNVNGGTPQTIVLDASGNSLLITFPLTFNTTYTLMSITSNGTPSCTQTLFNPTTINVMPLPTAIISGTTTICPGTSATVTFTGTPNAIVTYNENGGSNQTIVLNSTGTASLITPILTASSTYTLVSVFSNGAPSCTQPLSGIANINVIPNIEPTFNFQSNVFCLNDTPQQLNTTSDNGITGTWWPPFIDTTQIGTTLYTFTPFDFTCAITTNFIVNVIPLPTATILGPTQICAGGQALVNITGTPNATVTYNVDGGAPQTIVLNSSGNSSLTSFPITVNTIYTLMSVTSNGCTQPLSGVAVITVMPFPTDVVIASPATCFGSIAQIFFNGQPNTIVNFTIQNSFSGPINLTLDAAGNGTYTSFEFFSPGQYFIVVNSVTNYLGCSIVSNQSAVLIVIPPPMMTISTLYELCDDNNDGVECFDLHTKDSEICPNCASQGTTINYYLDANFTTPLPNIYCNTVNPQVIYALAMNNGCGSTTSMTLQAIPCTQINGDVSITSSNNTIGLLDTITVNVQLTNATDLYSLYMKLKGNAAVSQYLDYAGYTIGTLLGTGGSVIATTPTVTNGVYDFGITKVGTVPGYSGSGLFYSFRFVTKNSPIPTGTTFCFYLDEVNAYNTSGVLSALTNQGQYCYTFTNQVNVWPGDLNNSYTVTTADILPIGYFYNATGPARTNTTIQWSAHPATLWGYNHASINGDAYKVFADSNGDGVISNADQAAIGFNMNQIHAKMSVPTLDLFSAQTRQTLAAGDLIVTPDSAIINGATLPQTVTFTVSLNSTGGLSSLYGIATNLLFDATIFDLSTATIDYTGSIFGTTDTDCLVINYVSASIVSVGMTRYANAAINGQGLLFKITLQTKPTIAPLTQTQISATVEAANNQAGDALVIQEASLTTLNIINNLGINEVQHHTVTVYPNPAKEQITIQMSPTTFIKQIQLIDMLGRIIKTEHFTSSNTTATINLNEVAKGTYFIEVISDTNQKEIKKILVN